MLSHNNLYVDIFCFLQAPDIIINKIMHETSSHFGARNLVFEENKVTQHNLCECYASSLQAGNIILFRSYHMAPWQKSTLLSAVVDKGRRVFGNRSTQSLSGDLSSVTEASTTSLKIFKKSNDARRDMSVLAMTYILQDNSTIRELIRLIISLNDHDASGKDRKVCKTCNP